MNKNSIEIPLVKATYEELQQVICELQVERYKTTIDLEKKNRELQKRLDFMIEQNDKKQQVLDKIKEYANNRLNYYNEMRRDYLKEYDGYAENDMEQVLDILEEIE